MAPIAYVEREGGMRPLPGCDSPSKFQNLVNLLFGIGSGDAKADMKMQEGFASSCDEQLSNNVTKVMPFTRPRLITRYA